MNKQMGRKSNRSRMIGAAAVLTAALIAIGAAPTMAQSGAGKDTKKIKAKVEDAHAAIGEAESQVKETMTLYNALFEETKGGPEKTHKKLSKSVEGLEKAAEKASKSVESMRKDLEKFYAIWEEELAAFSSESMKQRAQKGLDDVKARFTRFDTALQGASDLYQPFIASLKDQVTLLGLDLSPATLSSLKEEAATLNETAEALYARIDEALNDTSAGMAKEGMAAEGMEGTEMESEGSMEGSESEDSMD